MMIKNICLFVFIVLGVACSKVKPKEGSVLAEQQQMNDQMAKLTKPSTELYTPDQMTEITFEEQNYDFGTISKKDGKVHHYYKFTNTGSKPLTIQVIPGCGCTAGKYTKTPIAPGVTDSVELEFNPKAFNGDIHKSARVKGNFPKEVILKFEGKVVQ